jgi:hypothetical protein
MSIATPIRCLGSLALLALPLMASRAAGEARAIDDAGRVVVVGNFRHVQQGNNLRRITDATVLGFEILDQSGITVSHGIVPGSESAGLDASPSLARDPLTGSLWLTWSRQADGMSPQEVVFIRSSSDIFWPSTLRVAASGSGDQVDPSMIFDSLGRIWLTWVDSGNGHAVELANFSPSGNLLGSRNLSDGVSTGNSAPAIGLDADGQALVAFLGLGASTGDQHLYVLAVGPDPGGFTHVPSPLVDLSLQGNAPTPQSVQTSTPDGPRVGGSVHLAQLAGVPVAWWAESDGSADLALGYAIAGSNGWPTAQVRRIALGFGAASVSDALVMVEARLRGPIDVSTSGGGPTPLPPDLIGGRSRVGQVRRPDEGLAAPRF